MMIVRIDRIVLASSSSPYSHCETSQAHFKLTNIKCYFTPATDDKRRNWARLRCERSSPNTRLLATSIAHAIGRHGCNRHTIIASVHRWPNYTRNWPPITAARSIPGPKWVQLLIRMHLAGTCRDRKNHDHSSQLSSSVRWEHTLNGIIHNALHVYQHVAPPPSWPMFTAKYIRSPCGNN